MLRKYGIWAMGFLIAAAMSYAFFASSFWGHSKSVPKVPPVAPKAEVTQQALKIKITPQTEVIQKIKYTKCGDEETLRETASQNLVGLTFQQFQQIYKDKEWTIETFDTKEIVLAMLVDGYCKTHSEHMFLGIYYGHVAVFYGEPGPKALLKEETNILLQDLQPQDRIELEKGIVVQDRSELLRTLEGLQEHR